MNRLIIAAIMFTLHGTKTNAAPVNPVNAKDYVIVLHGLGRTPLSMKRLEWTLRRKNYRVINLAYPSTRISVEDAWATFSEMRRLRYIIPPTIALPLHAPALSASFP